MHIFSRGFIWDIYLFDSAQCSPEVESSWERGSGDTRGPWRCIPLLASSQKKTFYEVCLCTHAVSEVIEAIGKENGINWVQATLAISCILKLTVARSKWDKAIFKRPFEGLSSLPYNFPGMQILSSSFQPLKMRYYKLTLIQVILRRILWGS